MKNILLLFFLCFAASISAQTRLNSATPKLFIENKGQITDKNGLPQPDIHFVLKDRHVNVFIGPQGIHYLFSKTEYSSAKQDKDSVIISTYRMQMHLTGTNPMSQLIRGNKNDYYENYYNVIGRPEGIPHVPTFEKITYKNIYPNIDWELYIVNEQLKYNFIIHTGGDPKNISIEYLNASDAHINSDGSLTVTNPLGEINESAPVSWMGKNKTPLKHKYKLVKKENRYEVEFTGDENGSVVYETNADIIIDPLIRWTSYYGGSLEDVLYATKTDENDNVFCAGISNSTNSIATGSSWKDTLSGYFDGILFKLSNTGTRLWATYYGGTYNDYIFTIAVKNNIITIAGGTYSYSNISTPNSHQFNNSNLGYLRSFFARMNVDGTRVWGSYYDNSSISANQGIRSITIDRFENIYIYGFSGEVYSNNNSITGALPGYFIHQNAATHTTPTLFLARFNAQGQRLWGTLYGKDMFVQTTPSFSEYPSSNLIDTDWDGNIYICGSTKSNDSTFYCQNAYKNSKSGIATTQEGFVAKFKPNGQRVWGTYLGGNSDDYLHSLTVDRHANVYVGGGTNSTGMNSNGWSSTGPGLITRFDSSGNHMWTSHAISVVRSMNADIRNNVLFSSDTPKYIGRFNANAQLISQHYIYENFRLYNSTIDGNGNIFYCGKTSSPSLNMTGSHQNTYGGGTSDGYIAKMWYDSSFRSTRPLLPKYKWCKGDSIWVKFNINVPYNTGNTMLVQLSNVPGILSSPVTVGTKNITGTVGADSIRIALPANLTPDSNYRVRIINSNPGDTSSYSLAFFVGQHAPNTLTLQNGFSTEICQGNYSQLLGTPQTGLLKYRWQRNGINLTAADTLRLYRAYTPGTYRVIVTTDAGCITPSTDTVVIVYPNPVSDIRINSAAQQCLTGNLFLFADSSKISAGSIASRTWTWTDSVSAISADTQRVFNTPGIYGVSLLVTSDKGCKHSSNKSVEVFTMPAVKINVTGAVQQCLKGHSFSFADSSSIVAGSYTRLWNFGDATTDTARQKNKNYVAAGSYTVKLNITS
ncbi:MAG: SBBP repeat-containing protein, partial [Bacteroidia bacterium]|nr:SBBP repeat-containing protein [Bacteroidia bacterium]